MRSRNLLVIFIVLMFGVIGALYVVGCSAQRAAAGMKTFVYACAADAQKLDPADVDDTESAKVLNNVCEGLVRFKSGTLRVEPCLAESWSISADGCLIFFAIREGVKFHDGTPLTAEAAAWSFRRQMDAKAPGHFANARFPFWQALYGDIEEVRALDVQRLQFKLKRPNAALLASLAIFPASIVSPKSLADYGEGMQRHPVGTGPFKFKEWLPNEKIVLDANLEYWGKKPKLGRAVFKVAPDNATRLALVQSAQGGAHAMDSPDPNSLPIITADANLRLAQAPGLNVAYLAFNCRKEPMTNVLLRRMASAALKKPVFAEVVYRGAGVEAHSVLPPPVVEDIISDGIRAAGLTGAKPPNTNLVDQTGEPPFDVEQARNLIAQMQMVTKTVKVATNDLFGLPITIETNVTERVEWPPLKLHVMAHPQPYLPDPVRAAEMVKADLETTGLKIEIVTNEFSAHLDSLRAGQYDLALHGCASNNGDPVSFLSMLDPQALAAGGAILASSHGDEELSAAIAAARTEMDARKRLGIYRRVLATLRDRLPLVPLAHATDRVVVRRNVKDFILQPTMEVRLGPVSLK